MALGGSGTSLDPYVVHDWDELVYSMRGYCVELANDIQAPSNSINLSSSTLWSLDGKEYAIIGVRCTSGTAFDFARGGSDGETIIKDLSFKNVSFSGGGYFIRTRPRGDSTDTVYDGVSFSGYIDSGVLINAAASDSYWGRILVNIATNLEIYGSFYLGENYFDGSRFSVNDSNIKLKYVNCSPTHKLIRKRNSDTGTGGFENCLIDLSLEQTTQNLDFGGSIKNCAIIGKGNADYGINVVTAYGQNVVEDTIPLTTSSSKVHSVTTAQMKNAQYLHDLGFPIGVN